MCSSHHCISIKIPKHTKSLHIYQHFIIEFSSFQYLVHEPLTWNICPLSLQAAIVTFVHTALDHREARDVIRETWGVTDIPDTPTRVVFALGDHAAHHDPSPGTSPNSTVMATVAAEAARFRDIVQADFLDTYRWDEAFTSVAQEPFVQERAGPLLGLHLLPLCQACGQTR